MYIKYVYIFFRIIYINILKMQIEFFKIIILLKNRKEIKLFIVQIIIHSHRVTAMQLSLAIK